MIAANPANQAFTALLRIQITGPDEQPILRGHPRHVQRGGRAGTTGSTRAAASSVPPVAADDGHDGRGLPAAHR